MSRRDCAFPIDRRSFLRGIAAGAASAPLASFAGQKSDKSRVVVAERPNYGAGSKVDKTVVKEAVDAMVKKLSGKTNVDEAWRTFVSPRETVALKFNGLFRRASTSPALVWAVCRGLVNAGLAPEKIIVFDRNEVDFRNAGIRPFEDLPKVRFLTGNAAWGEDVQAGPIKTRITRILAKDADAIINLPRLKHHVIAGVTLAMKNHVGSVPNPKDYHDHIDAIAELNALPTIRDKTRLAICDAIVGLFDGGPRFRGSHLTWKANALFAGTDVVAFDAVGAEMLRKARMAKKAGPTKPDPSHIAHAGQIGLGTADLNKIEIIKA